MTMFWEFSQNNSGGSFDYNEEAGITHFVVIEAENLDDVTSRAERIGLYWDGCADGRDCPCCGDRWCKPWRDEGTAEPTVYGTHPREYDSDGFAMRWMKPGREICVHYIDGRKEWF